MIKKPIILFILFLIVSMHPFTVIAGDKVLIPVSGFIFKEYARLDDVTNSLKKSSKMKIGCFYKVMANDGDELLMIDGGKTILEIEKGLKYKTQIYIKKLYLSEYDNLNVLFIDYNKSTGLNLISFTKIPQKMIESVYKRPPNIYEVLSDVKDKFNRIEQMTIQKRFLDLIDKKTTLSLQLAEGVSLEMVYVRGGEFLMGTKQDEIDELIVKSKTLEIQKEAPAHIVSVPEFYIGKYEVTNKQYALFLKEIKSKDIKKQTDNPDWDSMPVVNVSWNKALEFTKWLSSKLLLNVRLPTEDEWEWAARGPESLKYPWGNEEPKKKKEYGLWGAPFGKPNKVGSYLKGKSWCGAYDMAGNVYEWTYNLFYNYKGKKRNISSKQEKTYIVRGGSFANKLFDVRSASRYELLNPETQKINTGFRVIISLQ